MSQNIFERASQAQLRFNSIKGQMISTEDLWRIPLTSQSGNINLNDIARGISKQLKENDVEDFVGSTSGNQIPSLQMDIIKRVIEVKKAENAAKVNAKATKANDEFIDTLIADKKKEAMGELSIEDLEKMKS